MIQLRISKAQLKLTSQKRLWQEIKYSLTLNKLQNRQDLFLVSVELEAHFLIVT